MWVSVWMCLDAYILCHCWLIPYIFGVTNRSFSTTGCTRYGSNTLIIITRLSLNQLYVAPSLFLYRVLDVPVHRKLVFLGWDMIYLALQRFVTVKIFSKSLRSLYVHCTYEHFRMLYPILSACQLVLATPFIASANFFLLSICQLAFSQAKS